MTPDSLTVAVVWGRLAALSEEMAQALQHTAYSDQVREGGDYSTAVFDASGRLLAQANRSPAHLGSMPDAVRNMLAVYPVGELGPGDLIAMNDPYLGAGHLPDIFALAPVFGADELLGFVVATIHVTDIGGPTPGSQAVAGVTDLIQEGILLPPTRLYARGVPNREALALIEANVRVPELVMVSPEMDGAELSRKAAAWLANDWRGQSFMAVGMKDPVLGPAVMANLRKQIRGCPPPLEIAEGGHFVQEWGEDIAKAAVKAFA